MDNIPKMPGGFFILAVIIAIAIIVFSEIFSSRRRRAMARFARQHGMQFDSYSEFSPMLEVFRLFNEGHNRRKSNCITGRYHNLKWELFDYTYETHSGEYKAANNLGVVLALAPITFAPLHIRSENLFNKMQDLVGFEDINFESEEFSRAYHVACKDRKFAYDLLHPQMLAHLLTLPKYDWQFAGKIILIHKPGLYKPEELPDIMRAIEGFVAQIPPFLRQQYSASKNGNINNS